MAVTIEARGMMTAAAGVEVLFSNPIVYSPTGPGSPKGHLTLTNNTTGATKSYAVKNLTPSQPVWDWATDDPSHAVGDTFKIEYFGTASDGVNFTVAPAAGPGFSILGISGNGALTADGFAVNDGL